MSDQLPEFNNSKPKKPKRITKEEIDSLLTGPGGPNIRKFFEAVRQAEGGEPDIIVGGKDRFDINGDHPNRVGLVTEAGPSTAAGNYQILGSNWYGKGKLKERLGASNFSPDNQLRAAVMLLGDRSRGALDALVKGDFDTPLPFAGNEWAALPGSSLPGRKIPLSKWKKLLGQTGGGVLDKLLKDIRKQPSSPGELETLLKDIRGSGPSESQGTQESSLSPVIEEVPDKTTKESQAEELVKKANEFLDSEGNQDRLERVATYSQALRALPSEMRKRFSNDVVKGKYKNSPESLNAFVNDYNSEMLEKETPQQKFLRQQYGNYLQAVGKENNSESLSEFNNAIKTAPEAFLSGFPDDSLVREVSAGKIELSEESSKNVDASQSGFRNTQRGFVYSGKADISVYRDWVRKRIDETVSQYVPEAIPEDILRARQIIPISWGDPRPSISQSTGEDVEQNVRVTIGADFLEAVKASAEARVEATKAMKDKVTNDYVVGRINEIPEKSEKDENGEDLGISFRWLQEQGINFTPEEVNSMMSARAENDKLFNQKREDKINGGLKESVADLETKYETGRISAKDFITSLTDEKEAEAKFTEQLSKDYIARIKVFTPVTFGSAPETTEQLIAKQHKDLLEEYGSYRQAMYAEVQKADAWSRVMKRAVDQPMLTAAEATIRPVLKGFIQTAPQILTTLAGIIEAAPYAISVNPASQQSRDEVASEMKRLAKDVQAEIDKSLTDKDMRQLAYFSAYPEMLGGVLAQMLTFKSAGALTGAFVGGSQAASEQLNKANENPNASRTDKAIVLATSMMLAMPDVFIMGMFGEATEKAAKAMWYDRFLNSMTRKAVALWGEKEAIRTAKGVLQSVLKLGDTTFNKWIKPGAYEGGQESLEETGNSVVARLTYDDTRKILLFNKEDFIGGALLGPLGSVSEVASLVNKKEAVQPIGILDVLLNEKKAEQLRDSILRSTTNKTDESMSNVESDIPGAVGEVRKAKQGPIRQMVDSAVENRISERMIELRQRKIDEMNAAIGSIPTSVSGTNTEELVKKSVNNFLNERPVSQTSDEDMVKNGFDLRYYKSDVPVLPTRGRLVFNPDDAVSRFLGEKANERMASVAKKYDEAIKKEAINVPNRLENVSVKDMSLKSVNSFLGKKEEERAPESPSILKEMLDEIRPTGVSKDFFVPVIQVSSKAMAGKSGSPASGKGEGLAGNSSPKKVVLKLGKKGSETAAHILKLASDSFEENNELMSWFGSSKVRDKNGKPLPVFHGTAGLVGDWFDVSKTSDEMIHFGTISAANDRSSVISLYDNPDSGASVIPVFLKMENPLVLGFDPGTFETLDFLEFIKYGTHQLLKEELNIDDQPIKKGDLIKARKLYDQLMSTGLFMDIDMEGAEDYYDSQENKGMISEGLKKLGYDGIIYPNFFEGDSFDELSYAVFDTKQIQPFFDDGQYRESLKLQEAKQKLEDTSDLEAMEDPELDLKDEIKKIPGFESLKVLSKTGVDSPKDIAEVIAKGIAKNFRISVTEYLNKDGSEKDSIDSFFGKIGTVEYREASGTIKLLQYSNSAMSQAEIRQALAVLSGKFFDSLPDKDKGLLRSEYSSKSNESTRKKFVQGSLDHLGLGQKTVTPPNSLIRKFLSWVYSKLRQVFKTDEELPVSPEIVKIYNRMVALSNEPTSEKVKLLFEANEENNEVFYRNLVSSLTYVAFKNEFVSFIDTKIEEYAQAYNKYGVKDLPLLDSRKTESKDLFPSQEMLGSLLDDLRELQELIYDTSKPHIDFLSTKAVIARLFSDSTILPNAKNETTRKLYLSLYTEYLKLPGKKRAQELIELRAKTNPYVSNYLTFYESIYDSLDIKVHKTVSGQSRYSHSDYVDLGPIGPDTTIDIVQDGVFSKITTYDSDLHHNNDQINMIGNPELMDEYEHELEEQEFTDLNIINPADFSVPGRYTQINKSARHVEQFVPSAEGEFVVKFTYSRPSTEVNFNVAVEVSIKGAIYKVDISRFINAYGGINVREILEHIDELYIPSVIVGKYDVYSQKLRDFSTRYQFYGFDSVLSGTSLSGTSPIEFLERSLEDYKIGYFGDRHVLSAIETIGKASIYEMDLKEAKSIQSIAGNVSIENSGKVTSETILKAIEDLRRKVAPSSDKVSSLALDYFYSAGITSITHREARNLVLDFIYSNYEVGQIPRETFIDHFYQYEWMVSEALNSIVTDILIKKFDESKETRNALIEAKLSEKLEWTDENPGPGFYISKLVQNPRYSLAEVGTEGVKVRYNDHVRSDIGIFSSMEEAKKFVENLYLSSVSAPEITDLSSIISPVFLNPDFNDQIGKDKNVSKDWIRQTLKRYKAKEVDMLITEAILNSPENADNKKVNFDKFLSSFSRLSLPLVKIDHTGSDSYSDYGLSHIALGSTLVTGKTLKNITHIWNTGIAHRYGAHWARLFSPKGGTVSFTVSIDNTDPSFPRYLVISSEENPIKSVKHPTEEKTYKQNVVASFLTFQDAYNYVKLANESSWIPSGVFGHTRVLYGIKDIRGIPVSEIQSHTDDSKIDPHYYVLELQGEGLQRVSTHNGLFANFDNKKHKILTALFSTIDGDSLQVLDQLHYFMLDYDSSRVLNLSVNKVQLAPDTNGPTTLIVSTKLDQFMKPGYPTQYDHIEGIDQIKEDFNLFSGSDFSLSGTYSTFMKRLVEKEILNFIDSLPIDTEKDPSNTVSISFHPTVSKHVKKDKLRNEVPNLISRIKEVLKTRPDSLIDSVPNYDAGAIDRYDRIKEDILENTDKIEKYAKSIIETSVQNLYTMFKNLKTKKEENIEISKEASELISNVGSSSLLMNDSAYQWILMLSIDRAVNEVEVKDVLKSFLSEEGIKHIHDTLILRENVNELHNIGGTFTRHLTRFGKESYTYFDVITTAINIGITSSISSIISRAIDSTEAIKSASEENILNILLAIEELGEKGNFKETIRSLILNDVGAMVIHKISSAVSKSIDILRRDQASAKHIEDLLRDNRVINFRKNFVKMIMDNLSVEEKQFMFYKNWFAKRLLEEEIAHARLIGYSKLRIPTIATLARIEKYIEGNDFFNPRDVNLTVVSPVDYVTIKKLPINPVFETAPIEHLSKEIESFNDINPDWFAVGTGRYETLANLYRPSAMHLIQNSDGKQYVTIGADYRSAKRLTVLQEESGLPFPNGIMETVVPTKHLAVVPTDKDNKISFVKLGTIGVFHDIHEYAGNNLSPNAYSSLEHIFTNEHELSLYEIISNLEYASKIINGYVYLKNPYKKKTYKVRIRKYSSINDLVGEMTEGSNDDPNDDPGIYSDYFFVIPEQIEYVDYDGKKSHGIDYSAYKFTNLSVPHLKNDPIGKAVTRDIFEAILQKYKFGTTISHVDIPQIFSIRTLRNHIMFVKEKDLEFVRSITKKVKPKNSLEVIVELSRTPRGLEIVNYSRDLSTYITRTDPVGISSSRLSTLNSENGEDKVSMISLISPKFQFFQNKPKKLTDTQSRVKFFVNKKRNALGYSYLLSDLLELTHNDPELKPLEIIPEPISFLGNKDSIEMSRIENYPVSVVDKYIFDIQQAISEDGLYSDLNISTKPSVIILGKNLAIESIDGPRLGYLQKETTALTDEEAYEKIEGKDQLTILNRQKELIKTVMQSYGGKEEIDPVGNRWVTIDIEALNRPEVEKDKVTKLLYAAKLDNSLYLEQKQLASIEEINEDFLDKMEFNLNDSGDLIVNTYTAELVRRLASNFEGVTSPTFKAAMLRQEEVSNFIDQINEIIDDTVSDGASLDQLQKIISLRNALVGATPGIIVLVDQAAYGHETIHKLRYLNSELASEIKDYFHNWKQVKKDLEAITKKVYESGYIGYFGTRDFDQIPDETRQILHEEIFTYIADGNTLAMGLTYEEAAKFIEIDIDSYVKKHGEGILSEIGVFIDEKIKNSAIAQAIRPPATSTKQPSENNQRVYSEKERGPGSPNRSSEKLGPRTTESKPDKDSVIKERQFPISDSNVTSIELNDLDEDTRFYQRVGLIAQETDAAKWYSSVGPETAYLEAFMQPATGQGTARRMYVIEALDREINAANASGNEGKARELYLKHVKLTNSISPDFTEYGRAIAQLARWASLDPGSIAAHVQTRMNKKDPNAVLSMEDRNKLVEQAKEISEASDRIEKLEKKLNGTLESKEDLTQGVKNRALLTIAKALGRLVDFNSKILKASSEPQISSKILLAIVPKTVVPQLASKFPKEVVEALITLGRIKYEEGRNSGSTFHFNDWISSLQAELSQYNIASDELDDHYHSIYIQVRNQIKGDRLTKEINRIKKKYEIEDYTEAKNKLIEEREKAIRKVKIDSEFNREVKPRKDKRSALEVSVEYELSKVDTDLTTEEVLLVKDKSKFFGTFKEKGFSSTEQADKYFEAIQIYSDALDSVKEAKDLVRATKSIGLLSKGSIISEDETKQIIRQLDEERREKSRKANKLKKDIEELLTRPETTVEKWTDWYLRVNRSGEALLTGAISTATHNIIAQRAVKFLNAVEVAYELGIAKVEKATGLKVFSDTASDIPYNAHLSEIVKQEILGSTFPSVWEAIRQYKNGEANFLGAIQTIGLHKQRVTEGILAYNPGLYDLMLGDFSYGEFSLNEHRPNPNLGVIGKGVEFTVQAIEKYTHYATTLNRTQERHFRFATFLARVAIEMKAMGYNLDELVSEGKQRVIPTKVLENAIHRGLEDTFGEDIISEGRLGHFLTGVHNVARWIPFSLNPMLFRKFFFNANKYTFEHTPLILAKYATKGGFSRRDAAKFMMGTQMISMAVMLLILFGTDDDEPTTLKFGNSVVRFSAYNPISTFLVLANIPRRLMKGKSAFPNSGAFWRIFSIDTRYPNMGIEWWNSAINLMSNNTNREEMFIDKTRTMSGKTLTAFLRPVSVLKDIWAGFDPEEATVRDPGDYLFTGELAKTIPYVGRNFPARMDVKTGLPIREENTLLDQLGISIVPDRQVGPKYSPVEEYLNNAVREERDRNRYKTPEEKSTSFYTSQFYQMIDKGNFDEKLVKGKITDYFKAGRITEDQKESLLKYLKKDSTLERKAGEANIYQLFEALSIANAGEREILVKELKNKRNSQRKRDSLDQKEKDLLDKVPELQKKKKN